MRIYAIDVKMARKEVSDKYEKEMKPYTRQNINQERRTKNKNKNKSNDRSLNVLLGHPRERGESRTSKFTKGKFITSSIET